MSTVQAETIETQAGGPSNLTKQVAAKSWINFAGEGTVAINNSFNASSLTDVGVGSYSFALTNAMADVNAAVGLSGWRSDVSNAHGMGKSKLITTSSIDSIVVDTAGTAVDFKQIHGTAFGDLG